MNSMIFPFISDLVFILLILILEYFLFNKWKRSQNRLILLMIFFFVIIEFSAIYIAMKKIFPSIVITIGKGMTISVLFLIFIITMELLFIVYLKNYEKYYTLPIVIFSYIFLGLLLYENIFYAHLYKIISGVICLFYLVKIAIDNRNGLALSLGIFIIVFNLNFVNIIPILKEILNIFQAIPILMGSKGYVDKYVLYDRKEEQKVKSSWIAKRVK